MKKVIVLMVVLSLLMLCACKRDVSPETPDITDTAGAENIQTNPTDKEPNDTDPVGNETSGEWETPIDIDDFFQQEDVTTAGDATEPDATEPEQTTAPTVEPTTPPTEPEQTEPETSEPETTKKTNSSGAIELPFISG